MYTSSKHQARYMLQRVITRAAKALRKSGLHVFQPVLPAKQACRQGRSTSIGPSPLLHVLLTENSIYVLCHSQHADGLRARISPPLPRTVHGHNPLSAARSSHLQQLFLWPCFGDASATERQITKLHRAYGTCRHATWRLSKNLQV